MDSYTRAYMAATMPSCETLSSIGSVSANWSRTSSEEQNDEYIKYSNNDVLAESILASHGIAAYDQYIVETQARKVADRLAAEKNRVKKEARAAAMKRMRQRITALAAKLGKSASS